MPLYKAGADIDAFCTKCKMILAHVIVAMKGPHPVRVECKTCRAVHAYKREQPSGAKRAPTQAGPRPTELDKLMAGKDISKAIRYAPNVRFEEEQVVDHKLFGIGIVTRALSDQKIEVVFKDGVKVLVHDR
jgi:hypothetical protein